MRSLILLSVAFLAGCQCGGSSEATCKDPKPGAIVTVNQFCAVVHEDPVNPALMTEYKGQKVGFCCKGCMPKWAAMTDEQRDAALAAAIAKGKVGS